MKRPGERWQSFGKNTPPATSMVTSGSSAASPLASSTWAGTPRAFACAAYRASSSSACCVLQSITRPFWTRSNPSPGSADNSSKQARLAKLRSRISGAARPTCAAVDAAQNFSAHFSRSRSSRGLM